MIQLRQLFLVALTAAISFQALGEPVSAQLFQRQRVQRIQAANNCPADVVCTPQQYSQSVTQVIQLAPQQAPQAPQAITQDTQDTQASIVADVPHVRCIAGNSCGSGTICGGDGFGSYVVTNAHVAGTTLGRLVSVDVVSGGATKRVSGRVVMAGYSDSRMVDFCIIFVENLSSDKYMPMLKTEPENGPYSTTGSPRCVWPQVKNDFSDARNYGDGLITGLPNAIGGQSGSAIYNTTGQQIALLTWSMSGRCAGQKTSKLWAVATSRNVLLADPRPADLVELRDEGSERPVTENGVFGECPIFSETVVGDRPLTENTVSNVVGAAMDELPIWYVPGGTQPPCPPCPDVDPNDPNCVVLNTTEKALIDAIRAQETRNSEKAMDWLKLFQLFMEFMKLIQSAQ